LNINLLAPINPLGYGVAGQKILEALDDLGHEVSLFPIGPSEYEPALASVYNRTTARAYQFDPEAPSVRIYHQDQMAEHAGFGLRVGFPFFELDRFTLAEEHHLSHLHLLFVASEWARGVALASDIDVENENVHVVPLGVDRRVFHEALRQQPRMDPNTTTFINIGKWEVRKGHDVLLSAFNKAFQPTDNVQLRMINANPFIGQQNAQWSQMYEQSPMGPRIRVERQRFRTIAEVATALAGSDCGVWPARAEGWNLEALEMLSTGGHVIATGYSGHTEFLSNDNAKLIEVEDLEDAYDGVWFQGQGKWAAFGAAQEDQLIEHLRSVHRAKQCGELPLNEAGILTAKRFSWRNTAEAFVKGLS
jgi:glycosyltransferase involved in cell wall biosynthesis